MNKDLLMARAAVFICVMGLFSIGMIVLALLDVAHGEPDLLLEWHVVRIGLVLAAAANVAALVALGVRLRRMGGGEPSNGDATE